MKIKQCLLAGSLCAWVMWQEVVSTQGISNWSFYSAYQEITECQAALDDTQTFWLRQFVEPAAKVGLDPKLGVRRASKNALTVDWTIIPIVTKNKRSIDYQTSYCVPDTVDPRPKK